MNLLLAILSAIFFGCAILCIGVFLWVVVDIFFDRYREDGEGKK